MTIREVINRVQAIRQPAPPETDLLQIINDTEYDVLRKVISPRTEGLDHEDYDETDMNRMLKAPRPFDNLYVIACLKEIARREGAETEYNNAEREYKEIFAEYAAWWLRCHTQNSGRVRSDWYGV